MAAAKAAEPAEADANRLRRVPGPSDRKIGDPLEAAVKPPMQPLRIRSRRSAPPPVLSLIRSESACSFPVPVV
jgi:hypothetical protein